MNTSPRRSAIPVRQWAFVIAVYCCIAFTDPGAALAQDATFTNLVSLTSREAALKFVAPSGVNYRIDFSTNLSSTTNGRWQSLLTLQSAGVNQHTDSAAPFSSTRFYRAEQLTGTNILTGDNLSTTNGDIVFHPVNHASFVMSWNGRTIYNDPVGGATPYAGFPRADLILVSHSHTDHYDATTLAAVRGSNGVIIAPQAVYTAMSTALRSNTFVLAYGSATNAGGINILSVPAYNSYHPYGANNAYLLTIGGKRILTTGDSGDVPELRALTNIDLAFVCMNLPYTMTAPEATNDVRAFHPSVVYPYHYRDSSNATTNAAYFKQLLGLDAAIEVRLRKWY